MEAEIELTEFNSNKATLYRIDKWLNSASHCFVDEDVVGYFKALKLLRNEARVKMENPHKEKRSKRPIRTECDERWSEITDLYMTYQNSKTFNNKHNLMLRLESFEDFVRDYMDFKGMLLRDKPDDDGL